MEITETKIDTRTVLNIPSEARIIMMDTPFCSPREYSRRTGKSLGAVNRLISSGSEKLIIRKKGGDKEAVDINLAAMLVRALEEEDIDVVVVA